MNSNEDYSEHHICEGSGICNVCGRTLFEDTTVEIKKIAGKDVAVHNGLPPGEQCFGPRPVSEFVKKTELQMVQDKIRRQKHDIRCLSDAHQRLLNANADLKRSNNDLKKRNVILQDAWNKKMGIGPNWLCRTLRDVGMVLLRLS